MNQRERDRFDRLLEAEIESLPPGVRTLLEETPVIVEDRPSRQLLRELGMGDDDLLCGLHTGVPITERSVEHPDMESIRLFREGIIETAGGWEAWESEEGEQLGGEEAVKHEIHITLLHEIGHHYGLEEDDLERLGYG
jgi:predicted Zn-dependent protease with MMP-like domain